MRTIKPIVTDGGVRRRPSRTSSIRSLRPPGDARSTPISPSRCVPSLGVQRRVRDVGATFTFLKGGPSMPKGVEDEEDQETCADSDAAEHRCSADLGAIVAVRLIATRRSASISSKYREVQTERIARGGGATGKERRPRGRAAGARSSCVAGRRAGAPRPSRGTTRINRHSIYVLMVFAFRLFCCPFPQATAFGSFFQRPTVPFCKPHVGRKRRAAS